MTINRICILLFLTTLCANLLITNANHLALLTTNDCTDMRSSDNHNTQGHAISEASLYSDLVPDYFPPTKPFLLFFGCIWSAPSNGWLDSAIESLRPYFVVRTFGAICKQADASQSLPGLLNFRSGGSDMYIIGIGAVGGVVDRFLKDTKAQLVPSGILPPHHNVLEPAPESRLQGTACSSHSC